MTDSRKQQRLKQLKNYCVISCIVLTAIFNVEFWKSFQKPVLTKPIIKSNQNMPLRIVTLPYLYGHEKTSLRKEFVAYKNPNRRIKDIYAIIDELNKSNDEDEDVFDFNDDDYYDDFHEHREDVYAPTDDNDIDPLYHADWTERPKITDVRYKYGNETSEVCTPFKEWHRNSFPTCNVLHEMPLQTSMKTRLSNGNYRDIWLVHTGTKHKDLQVLKTLRIERDFDTKDANSHRIDALVAERLTSSPRVMDIYGFCGQSVINAVASSGSTAAFTEQKLTPIWKLKYARDAAMALADFHGIDDDSHGKGGSFNVTVFHHDVRTSNFLWSKDKKTLLLHDFNRARFLMWDKDSHTSCGILKTACSAIRSPEECIGKPITEKVDIYSFASVLYVLLTGYQPYEYPIKLDRQTISKHIVNGRPPLIPTHIRRSRDLAIRAIISVMQECQNYNPVDRPSARDIANFLSEELKSYFSKMKKARKKGHHH